jgi:hypothetical protein
MTDANVVTETEPTPPPQGGVPASGGDNGAAPAAKTNGNILEAEGDGAPAAATWPEDWRQRWAGDDVGFLKTLNRYSSPENVAKAFGSLRAQLHAGELIKKLPDGASPEETAEWRAQMGLPEKPDGYQLTRVMGHEWTDGDKPNLESFITAAHGSNFTQAQLDTALDWYGKQIQAQEEKRFENDTVARQQLEDTLRTEWGPEFRGNIGLMKRYLEHDVPDGAGAALVDARLSDGSRLIDQPWFAKWVVDLARDSHGEAAFVGTGEGIAASASRKAEIENVMHTDPNRYYKDKGMQAEYLRIVQREESSRR